MLVSMDEARLLIFYLMPLRRGKLFVLMMKIVFHASLLTLPSLSRSFENRRQQIETALQMRTEAEGAGENDLVSLSIAWNYS